MASATAFLSSNRVAGGSTKPQISCRSRFPSWNDSTMRLMSSSGVSETNDWIADHWNRNGTARSLPADGVSLHVEKDRAQNLGDQGTNVRPIRWRVTAGSDVHLANLQVIAEGDRCKRSQWMRCRPPWPFRSAPRIFRKSRRETPKSGPNGLWIRFPYRHRVSGEIMPLFSNPSSFRRA